MNSTIAQQVLAWIQASPTPYHAVHVVKFELLKHGFVALDEGDVWQLKPGGKYFVTRRDASILAFRYGTSDLQQTGLRIVGAHTDSPTLKVKPRPEKLSQGYFQLGIEVYGGVLLSPWFDRDLSLAGRVTFRENSTLTSTLINFSRPIAIIPSLAIHLDRGVNEGRAINPQEHMNPVLLQSNSKDVGIRHFLAEEIRRTTNLQLSESDILDFDLSFYDVQPPAILGMSNEFIAASRLDNLLSCFIGLHALLNNPGDTSGILALFDHEEVGSQSDIGARSNLLNAFCERLVPDAETRLRMLHKSLLLSVDNAHGIHPNFPQKHDDQHGPKLNGGPVIKYDANQGYATSSESAAAVKLLAEQAQIPLQVFVTRADTRCGSTIGPMSAANTGIKVVDLGIPTFAMHSIRELAGIEDLDHLSALLIKYFEARQLSY
jgi:aspartyl aminopeptidase